MRIKNVMKNGTSQRHESIEKDRYKDLAIFTGSLYKYTPEDYQKDPIAAEQNLVRGNLALKTLQNASNLGVNVVVHDMGSCPDWMEKARQIKGVKVIDDKQADGKLFSMGRGRRKALETAMKEYNTDYYLWTEAEKDDLITEANLDAMVNQARTNQYDIIIPRRKDTSSYPDFQRREEELANRTLSAMMKKNGDDATEEYDFFFAPKIMTKVGAKYFLEYNKDNNAKDLWDAIMVPVLLANENGKKIGSVDVDYAYDPKQKENEEQEPTISTEKEFINSKGEQKITIRNRTQINEKRLKQYVLIINEAKKQLKIKKEAQKNISDIFESTP